MSTAAFYYIEIAITFLASLTALLNYSKKNRILLPVVLLLGYTFLTTVINYLMAKYLRNNVPVDHFVVPGLVGGWGIFFSQVLEDPRVKKYIVWATIILISYSVINSFVTGLNVTPWVVLRVVTIFNLILGGLLLIQMLDLSSKENVFTNTFFLIALAIVWFNMISSLSFFLYDFLAKHKPSGKFMSRLHFISNYVYYSILLLAMLFQNKLNKDA